MQKLTAALTLYTEAARVSSFFLDTRAAYIRKLLPAADSQPGGRYPDIKKPETPPVL